ncbi:MAG: hypothetical protein ACE5JL_15820 [Dehalococcoidia bacterium]
MGKDIPTLVKEFRAIIDDWVEELLTFDDSDLGREDLLEDEWGRRCRTLRGAMEEWLDEIQIHTGQIQGARYNVAYRKIFGEELDASPPEHMKSMKPVNEEAEWGMYGRTHTSRLAGEVYIAGHQLLAQFIGVDKPLMEEPSRPGEWSGRQVLEHLIGVYTPSRREQFFVPWRKEGDVPKT